MLVSRSHCVSPGATGISGLHSRRTRGDRHSSRVEAKKPALLSSRDGYLENRRHPFMHRTETVDYAVVLEGEVTMLLDDSEVHLKQGDVVIQRGTNHAWSNRSKKPVRM